MPILRVFPLWTYLAFATQPSEQLIALKLGLLIGHNARHLEDEPGWSRLFVQAHSVERQHTHPRMLAHCVHHLRRRGFAPDHLDDTLSLSSSRMSPRSTGLYDTTVTSYYIREIVLLREKKWKAPKVVKWSQITLYPLSRDSPRSIHKITARRHSRQQGHAQCGASVKTGASNRKARGVPPPGLTRSWELGTASEVSGPPSSSPSLSHWITELRSSQPARLPIQPSGGDIVTLGAASLHPDAEGERREIVPAQSGFMIL